MTSCTSHYARISRQRGFTLVEVAMALGIVSFAFITLLGMLPLGLNMFRDAVEVSASSRIFQRVSGDLQQSDFDTLSTGNQPVRYFDDQGNELPDRAGSLYWTKAVVYSGANLPGTHNNGDIVRVVIQLAYNPSRIDPTENAEGQWVKAPSINLTKRAIFVARNTTTPRTP